MILDCHRIGLVAAFAFLTSATLTDEAGVTSADMKMLPSGTCWQEINRWRENPTFDDAMNRFHEKCRWATPANESCDATACLDAEARVHRWMGDMLPHCRNLSCEDSHPQCAQLQQLLVPGCTEAAFFLEEDEDGKCLQDP
ncbi:hypothetical protein BV898_19910 [Hypsibius exemplaris]|uniref:FZ domain-containing protein n=1 Tax=Hypsibius exemplaris TaxID=2072580 RepID=A0A9X6NRU3_HYPEX|nr:hypothetical protein BV898_19910 [Hypsibius exemplaris]